MIGRLPLSLNVGGVQHEINADFRNILTIIAAYNDPDLPPKEQAYICLKRLYKEMPKDIEAAYEQAKVFIGGGIAGEEKNVKLINWTKDEALIFPAINRVAGQETRLAEFIHWHTFLGYFMEINDSVFSTVLSIRLKREEGRKLEKWEQEWYSRNLRLVDIKNPVVLTPPEQELLKSLRGDTHGR